MINSFEELSQSRLYILHEAVESQPVHMQLWLFSHYSPANDVLAPRRVMYGAVHPNSNKTRHFAGIPNAHYHHLLISECVPAFGKEKKKEWAIFLGAAIC